MNKMVQSMKERAILRGVLTSGAVYMIICLVGTAVYTGFLLGGKLEWTSMYVYTWILQMLASMVGTIVAGRVVGGKYAIIAGLTSVLYVFILLAATITFFGGVFDHVLGNAVSIVVGAVCACAICIRSDCRARGKKRYIR